MKPGAAPGQLEIRRESATIPDAVRLVAEMVEDLTPRYGRPASPFSPADVDHAQGCFLVARLDGAAIACAALRPLEPPETAEIKRMFVCPEARRRGIARRLLGELERVASELGYHRVRLETGVLQPEAVALYEGSGYRRIPAYGRYVDDPINVCFEKSLRAAVNAGNPYETARLLDEYLLFHYGRPEEILPYGFGPVAALNFPARAVRECLLDVIAFPRSGARALDVGCAVGRTSFELARLGCAEVIGVDFSANFIRAANALRADGRLAYRRADEGQLTTELVAEVPTDIDRGRVRFVVGDAGALDVPGTFDVVVALNLLCRLPAPRRLLASLPGLVKPGGQLLLATPCSWLEEYTAPDEWLGGFTREADGQAVRTFDTLRTVLEPDFELVQTRDLPFLIREHARKFQWSVSQASTWRRQG